MYTQGNIIPKVWFYKDKRGNVLGPFMSYDMDIWNDEKDYFSEHIEVSLVNASGPFYPLNKFVNRDPEIIEIVEDFVSKNVINQEPKAQNKKSQKQNPNQT